MSRNKGFTLIELLIVVAIIAILAAIAIPNFLQAQVRAKVSRAKSELNMINTALESYFVDNNAYCEDFVGGDPAGPNWPYYLGISISTPISYISSSKVNDPFALINANADPSAEKVGRRYRYINWGWSAYHTIFPQGTEGDGMWRTYSVGPDGRPASLSNEWYDPTNGTVSNGDIYRTQKYGSGRLGVSQ